MDMPSSRICAHPTAQADRGYAVASTATNCCCDASWRIMVVEHPPRAKSWTFQVLT